MLILTRRVGEKILFPTINASVEVISLKGGAARVGVDAPAHVAVFREELLDDNLRQQLDDLCSSVTAEDPAVQALVHKINNRLNGATIGLALLRQQLDRNMAAQMGVTIGRIEQEVGALKQTLATLAAPPAVRSAAVTRRRALLVEDDVNECELLAGFLRMAGLDVDTASDGADALDHLRANGRPDVLLLDMLMPRTDGPTTVRAIRDNPDHSGLRIFGITGADPQRFGLPAGQGGIDHWFQKPLDPQALLAELSRELEPVR